jgi:Phage head-tail joining protein
MPAAGFLNGRTSYTYLRGAAFLFLSEVGYPVRGSAASDSGGGAHTTWMADPTGVPCRVDAMGGGESESGAKISENTTHLIVLPAQCDVSEMQRFAISNRGTFEITAVPERTGEFLRTIEAVEL